MLPAEQKSRDSDHCVCKRNMHFKSKQSVVNYGTMLSAELRLWLSCRYLIAFPMRIRRVYEELLKQEKRQVLQLKCLSGAAAFIFVAGFFVVFLGLDVVRKIAKGFSYKGANCVVEGSVITGISESCTCGMHPCISQYPCLQVMVRVIDNRAEKSESSKLVLLYNNIYDLGSNVSTLWCRYLLTLVRFQIRLRNC